jgi:hypothetical protein
MPQAVLDFHPDVVGLPRFDAMTGEGGRELPGVEIGWGKRKGIAGIS